MRERDFERVVAEQLVRESGRPGELFRRSSWRQEAARSFSSRRAVDRRWDEPDPLWRVQKQILAAELSAWVRARIECGDYDRAAILQGDCAREYALARGE